MIGEASPWKISEFSTKQNLFLEAMKPQVKCSDYHCNADIRNAVKRTTFTNTHFQDLKGKATLKLIQ